VATGGNVRSQHDPAKPVGKALSLTVSPDGHRVRALIIDKKAARLIKAGVLRAFSIGIKNPVIRRDPSGRAAGGIICGGELVELSIVDRPANRNSYFQIAKSAGGRCQVTQRLVMKNHHFICTECGQDTDRGERFCTNCGAPNKGFTPLADRQLPMNKGGCCLKCGMRNKKSHASCGGCGSANLFYKPGKGAMGKKRKGKLIIGPVSAKAMRADVAKMVTGRAIAGSSASDWRGRVLHQMWVDKATGCDPSQREIARDFLGWNSR
jgi:hypothetical protein